MPHNKRRGSWCSTILLRSFCFSWRVQGRFPCMNVVSRPVLGCQHEPPYLLSSWVKQCTNTITSHVTDFCWHMMTVFYLNYKTNRRFSECFRESEVLLNMFKVTVKEIWIRWIRLDHPGKALGGFPCHIAYARSTWMRRDDTRREDTRVERTFLLFSKAQRPVWHCDTIRNTYWVFISGSWPEFLKPWGFPKW